MTPVLQTGVDMQSVEDIEGYEVRLEVWHRSTGERSGWWIKVVFVRSNPHNSKRSFNAGEIEEKKEKKAHQKYVQDAETLLGGCCFFCCPFCYFLHPACIGQVQCHLSLRRELLELLLLSHVHDLLLLWLLLVGVGVHVLHL